MKMGLTGLCGLLLLIQLPGCSSSSNVNENEGDAVQENAGFQIASEFHGVWQNTIVPENYWVIDGSSITNYAYFPPQPCSRMYSTLLSENTFTFEIGSGANTQTTFYIENDELVLQSPRILARHKRSTSLPDECLL